MGSLSQHRFQRFGCTPDCLNLLAVHVDPWRGVIFPGNVQGLADAVSHHQTLVKDVHQLQNGPHLVPLDALASLAAFAAAGLALALLESGQLVELPFSLLVESLLFGSGELGGLPPGWFHGFCFGWGSVVFTQVARWGR